MRNLRTHRSLFIAVTALAVIALGWLLGAVLFGFQIHIFEPDPMQSLASARVLWQQKGGDAYRLDVRITQPFFIDYFQVTVRSGKVVEAATGNPVAPPSTPPPPFDHPIENPAGRPLSDQNPSAGAFDDFMVDKLFDTAQSHLASMPPAPLVSTCGQDGRYWHATFDPNLGYLTTLEFYDCSYGLLCGGVGDCRSLVQVSNFELLGNGN